jgi:hypothetical protein
MGFARCRYEKNTATTNGVATLTVTGVAAGPHTITAVAGGHVGTRQSQCRHPQASDAYARTSSPISGPTTLAQRALAGDTGAS